MCLNKVISLSLFHCHCHYFIVIVIISLSLSLFHCHFIMAYPVEPNQHIPVARNATNTHSFTSS